MTAALEHRLTPESKVFFLHMPKAAGTSFNYFVENHFAQAEVCPHFHNDPLCEVPRADVQRYRYYRGHIYYDLLRQLLDQKPISLTMLRDPVERFISQFAHILRHADVWGPYRTPEIRERLAGLTLEAFVEDANHDLAIWNKDVQADLLGSRMELVFAASESPLPKALNKASTVAAPDLPNLKSRLTDFEFVGLTERFRESVWLLCYLFGWRPLYDFQPINVSEHKPPRPPLAAAVHDKISDLNALDLALYQHGQQLFDQRLERMSHDLLEKYGTRADAHRSLPLAPDAVQGLLEHHYRQRFSEANHPQRFFQINGGDGLSGSGWHLPIKQRKFGYVRWTGPTPVSSIDLHLDNGSDYELIFKTISAANFAGVQALRLKVNGQPIPILEKYKCLEASIFVAQIPQAAVALDPLLTRFTFETDSEALTENYVPTDDIQRPTGVLFSWLDVRPIPDSDQTIDSSLSHRINLQARILETLESELMVFDTTFAQYQAMVAERDRAIAFLQNELGHAQAQTAMVTRSKFWTLRNYFHTIRSWFQKEKGER
jgi:hypothetical protein